MNTRKQYIDNECTHQEYYSQFGRDLLSLVENTIGRDRIINSTDEHFNDIPLRRWDSLRGSVMAICGKKIAATNGSGGVSLSDCVCSAKAAAQIIRSEHKS